jgi:hypothetical protein
MTEQKTIKVNRDTLELLRNQNPDESFNEICGWALFELNYIEKNAKKLNIPLEQYKEATLFVNFISRLLEYKNVTLTEVLKSKDCKYDEATRSLISEENYD